MTDQPGRVLTELACPLHGPDHLAQIPNGPARKCMAMVHDARGDYRCNVIPCGRCGNDKGSWMSNRCDVCYRLDAQEQRDREAQARWDEREEARQIRAERDTLAAQVKAVLGWVAEMGCTCPGDFVYGSLADHENECPAQVEHLLTLIAPARGTS